MQSMKLLASGCLIASLLACTTVSSAKQEVNVQTAKVERLVSLAPNLTEAIFALGAGDLMVGRSNYCVYPSEAIAVDRVGRLDAPKIERILAMRPDRVLVTNLTPLDVITRMQNLGLEVIRLRAERLEDITTTYRELGVLLSRETEAAALIGKFEAAMEAALAVDVSALGRRPKACLIYGFEAPYYSAGKGTFPSELLAQAGFENLADRAPLAWPQLNLEWLVQQNPDCLFIAINEATLSMESQLAQMRASQVWSQINAVSKGRVYFITGDALSVPGLRALNALKVFSKARAVIEIP